MDCCAAKGNCALVNAVGLVVVVAHAPKRINTCTLDINRGMPMDCCAVHTRVGCATLERVRAIWTADLQRVCGMLLKLPCCMST